MDFESIARSIGNQFVTVWNAPIPFLAVLLVVGYVIWRICQWQHGVRIAHLNSQLELYREANAVSVASSANTIPPAPVAEALPAEPAPPGPAPVEREFVGDDITPNTVRKLFWDGGSTLASQMAAAPFVGKWMKISGHVANMSLAIGVIMVSLRSEDANILPVVNLSFSGDGDQLAAIGIGDPITAIGKLYSAEPLSIFFVDCELVATPSAAA